MSSHGIFGQSVGGGGGNGALAAGLLVALGGSARGGNDSGSVIITNGAGIATTGVDARGVFAQSIGGGGGSANGTFGLVALGGSGGSGGDGGRIELTNSGVVSTMNSGADALFAQSVGGGGGAAATSAGLISLGGSGGDSGDGGDISVNNNALLSTDGNFARGIFAQSVGGGGGIAGLGSDEFTGDAGDSFGLVTFGGTGGGAGSGGRVAITNLNAITTRGAHASAIQGQSIGGGGGEGGVSGGVLLTIGGGGSDGGDGGTVTLANSQNLSTQGNDSHGVFLESVGGGGGRGGNGISGSLFLGVSIGGDGGDLDISFSDFNVLDVGASIQTTPTLETQGDRSNGILALSVGGGGGDAGIAVQGAAGLFGAASVAVGGSGGNGGDGGNISLDGEAIVATEGEDSEGILIESIGGGGGNGGFSVAGALAIGKAAGALGVSVGGSGGDGGNGGNIEFNSGGSVSTGGARSDGIIVQTTGGGGGNGGFSVSGAVAGGVAFSGTATVGVGGSGGGGGNGGDVNFDFLGGVSTEGVDADAVILQSVGGGGGNGGFNTTSGISVSGTNAVSAAIGVGASGSDGGSGGHVDARFRGNISTTGFGSDGLLVQSVGGGGGNAGFNVVGGVTGSVGVLAGSISVGVGGSGGGGGQGGKVDLIHFGDVSTVGSLANGIIAQSTGGSGGNGDFNITGGINATNKFGGSVNVGVGGSGGAAGDGAEVTANISGAITSMGFGSDAVLIQSIGGNGGNAGLNVTGGITASVGSAGTVSIGIGGAGGGGGDAGEVNSTVEGSVTTSGDSAQGVIAQSLGGGNGGINVSGAVSLATGSSGSASVGIGGFGGRGGESSAVNFNRIGATSTNGVNSDAIVVQSLAGGGGNGGLNVSGALTLTGAAGATLTAGVGGFGGDGGDASSVTANINGDVIAMGAGSNGLVAQSLGGGGGNGALNVTGGVFGSSSGSSGGTLNLGIGGFGGGGGNASSVDLNLEATQVMAVSTLDFVDDTVLFGEMGGVGVLAQSVGGGGGNGGFNISGGLSTSINVNVGIGGSGGGAGTGGAINAVVNSDITTSGTQANGLVAQSIGGGGGNGAFNVSGGISFLQTGVAPIIALGLGGDGGDGNISGDVSVDQDGDITVTGSNSSGLIAQSIAGGGGNGAFNVSGAISITPSIEGLTPTGALAIGIGGSGGAGADASDVFVDSAGDILLTADFSTDEAVEDPEAVVSTGAGLFAQSVGGGGGNGGFNIAGAAAFQGNTIAVGVGGSGDGGGNAGLVTVNRGAAEDTGLISTTGNNVHGLVAQSIGGGGGNGGFNIASASGFSGSPNSGFFASDFALQIVVGGSGGQAGDGGITDVTHLGDIMTQGNSAVGLIAQSIGGGGGNAGVNIGAGIPRGMTALNLAIGGGTGDGGLGENVTVNHTGNITTAGMDAFGILAQSIGGGGGNTNSNMSTGFLSGASSLNIAIGRTGGTGGEGSDVLVNAEGIVSTTGDRSVGILAQSIGGGGGTSGSISVGATTDSVMDFSLGVEVGLDGGLGNSSGDVVVNTLGSITTTGNDASAILTQSIGGGGGLGGSIIDAGEMNNFGLSVGIGGQGGVGSGGGHIDVINSAALSTNGERSHGVYAQSIGGSGGTGGFVASITTPSLSAVPGQTFNFGVSVGGNGGEGGAAGGASIQNFGSIITTGAEADGVRVQSIGGGGGDGGLVVNGGLMRGQSNSILIGVGGEGGQGGTGSNVDVINEGLIQTSGDSAVGISAMSIGGGGGDAGFVGSLNIAAAGASTTTRQLGINIGGAGGAGGTSGNVAIINRLPTDIATDATETSDSAGDPEQDTSLTSNAIITAGNNAHGIFAQSVAGGGGNGSAIISSSFAMGMGGVATPLTSNSVSLAINIGGVGGSGNSAGDVVVTNETLIDTTGSNAHGVFAQSIGGGGNGGFALAANAVLASPNGGGIPGSLAPLVVVGGEGGTGGAGGLVTVNNSGQIVTRGVDAHGILAQSIGGGGGNAGIGLGLASDRESLAVANVLSALLGGTGGDGGLGGNVTVNHSGDITVLGDGSQAIKAESINGGGGTIDLNFDGISTLPGGEGIPFLGAEFADDEMITTDPSIDFSGGGQSVSNSGAGKVTLNVTGTFGTAGDNGVASGVQTIGGGGGTVNVDLNLAMPADSSIILGSPSVNGKLGGVEGENNPGGNIVSGYIGDIVTSGSNTLGVLFQSIGGGGGRANVEVDSIPDLLGDLTFLLGGSDGQDEQGGLIDYEQDGSITTTGDLATGLLLQSLGGGGGSLFFELEDSTAIPSIASDSADFEKVSASVPLFVAVSNAVTGVNVDTYEASFGFGSVGGTNLDGGDIATSLTGNTLTFGDNASGLVVQSIGAGGGEARITGLGKLAVSLGGSGGATGNGGDLSVTNTGNVTTVGQSSHGIFLQSIGGGGGAVFTKSDISSLNLSTENAGDGGNVQLSQTGNIRLEGNNSIGVFAQSIGGGGGFVDDLFTGTSGGEGAGGAVSVDVLGDIVAVGTGATGIFAQSAGGIGTGDITIEFDGDILASTLGSTALFAETGSDSDILITIAQDSNIIGGEFSIKTAGGAITIIENAGVITTSEWLEGTAISANSAVNQIFNNGIVLGNILLGGSGNEFVNSISASLIAGTSLDLGGTDNSLINNGSFSPGSDRILQTDIDGNFAQTATGETTLTLVQNVGNDLINVTGGVTLDGTLNIDQTGFVLGVTSLFDSQTDLMGSFATVNGLSTDGILLQQALEFDTANADVNVITLFTDANTVTGLTQNQAATANALLDGLAAEAFDQKLIDLGILLGVLPDVADVSFSFEQLHPEILDTGMQIIRGSQTRFLTQLLDGRDVLVASLQLQLLASADGVIPARQKKPAGPQFWTSSQFVRFEQDSGSELAFNTDGVELAAGARNLPLGPVRFGVAFGYIDLDSDLTNQPRDSVDTEFARLALDARLPVNQGGQGLKGRIEGAIVYAAGESEVDRIVDLKSVGFVSAQTATADFTSFGGTIRFGVDGFNGQNWLIKPYISVGGDFYDQDDVNFNGSPVIDLTTNHVRLHRFTFGYGAVLETDVGSHTKVRASVSGRQHFGDTQSQFASEFNANTAPVNRFATVGRNIDDQYYADVGISHTSANNWSVTAQGFIEFGDLNGGGASIRAAKQF